MFLLKGRTSIAEVDSQLFTPYVRRRVEKLQRMKIDNYVEKVCIEWLELILLFIIEIVFYVQFGREKVNSIIAKAISETEKQILGNRKSTIDKNSIINKILNESNNNEYTNEGFVKSDETKFWRK